MDSQSSELEPQDIESISLNYGAPGRCENCDTLVFFGSYGGTWEPEAHSNPVIGKESKIIMIAHDEYRCFRQFRNELRVLHAEITLLKSRIAELQ